MGTVKEEFELLKSKILAGKENETIHVVWHEAERRRKRENPTKSTRMVIDTRSPENWRDFQMEKERYMIVCSDPGIAIALMIRALRQPTDEELRAWLADGAPDEPGPPPAEYPEWLRE